MYIIVSVILLGGQVITSPVTNSDKQVLSFQTKEECESFVEIYLDKKPANILGGASCVNMYMTKV